MSVLRPPYKEIDLPMLGATLALVGIGILSIYSAGITSEGIQASNEYLKQIIWAASGTVFMALAFLVDYKRIKDYSLFAYAFLLVILVYTRFFGRVVNGARSWLGIGEYGIQPSEFMKLGTILFLAFYLSESEHEKAFPRLLKAFAIIGVPLLLILSQPDFGTSLVFFPIFIFMIYAAGVERRYITFILAATLATVFLTVLPLWDKAMLNSPRSPFFMLYQDPYRLYILLAAFVVLLLSAWGWASFKKRYYYWIAYISLIASGALGASALAHKVLKEYQLMRLIVFLDPSIDPRGSGWNILQSITAIGSGGLMGKGFLQGTQSHYRYIPQQSTDFIFSIIAEEWGFIGGLVVFSLFFLLMRRCINLVKTTKDRFATYVAAGVLGMLFFHFMINAGMAMGIMPITGIPLFFLSYGGSSLWAVMTAIGLLLGISARRYRM